MIAVVSFLTKFNRPVDLRRMCIMPKFFRNAEFGRVAYSICVTAAVCFLAYGLALPAKQVGAQKFDKKSLDAPPTERLATTTFPTSTALPASIPDATAAGINLTVPVSGLTDDLRGVALNIAFDQPAGPGGHTWIGDLIMTLSSPAPSNSHVILHRVGSTTGTSTGDSSNVIGPYTFSDGGPVAPGDIWVTAASGPSSFDIPAGPYRTTACCAPSSAGPAIITSMNPVFQGPVLHERPFSDLPANVANGSWTLNISDNAGGDTGRVSALSLTLTTLAPTAAHARIQGLVITPTGRPIANARVSILNAETLETQTVTTNQFGLFNFDGLPVENFYTMWVEHGRYQFDQPVQSFVLVGDLTGARFVSSK